MPTLGERPMCSERIFIPPSFPSIMKGYCKAAIRTQPYDLLRWSAAYFRALANGENPPVKERLEFPAAVLPPGLTPGYLKVLVNQLGKDPETLVDKDTISEKWGALCLPPDRLDPLLSLLGGPNFHWLRFLAVAAGSISSSLSQTMILICELLTDEPEGGAASIPVETFTDLYGYLAYLDGGSDSVAVRNRSPTSAVDDKEFLATAESNLAFNEVTPLQLDVDQDSMGSVAINDSEQGGFPGIGRPLSEEQVSKVVTYMNEWAARQGGLVMPRNIRHWMCPPLDEISTST